MIDEAEDIRSYELRPIDGESLPAFEAGAHINLHIEGGFVRQYSLCNSPAESDRYVIGVQRETGGRGGSQAVFQSFRVGDQVLIGAPRNHFALTTDTQRAVLIGGGIGITPLLAMAEQLHESGIPFELLYRARSRSRAGFLDRLRNSAWNTKATVVLSDGPEYDSFSMAGFLGRSSTGAHLYTCGPEGFVTAVERAATSAQFPPGAVHKELFTNTSLQGSTEHREFKVTLAESGGTYTIPCGKSVAEVLEEEGISILVSCEQGVCGSCVVPVIDGIPDHRDVFLTDEEHEANNEFTPCCSRALTDNLVIAI